MKTVLQLLCTILLTTLAFSQVAFSADQEGDQVWGCNNVDAVSSGGTTAIAVSVLELKKGGTCKMTLATASGQTASSGTWKLTKDGESLSYDISLSDGSRSVLMTKVGGVEAVLTKNGDIVAVFKRRS